MSLHNGHLQKFELLLLSTEDEPLRLHNALLHVEYLTGSETEYDIRVTFEGDERFGLRCGGGLSWGKIRKCGCLGGTFKSQKPRF